MQALRGRLWSQSKQVALALGLVAIVTLIMYLLVESAGLSRGSSAYLIPVVFAALRWGIIPAAAAAIAGAIGTNYLFYTPIYDLRLSSSAEVVDLTLYCLVAIIIIRMAAQLSEARVRAQTNLLRQALVDSVSHELRTPLSSILGAASVMATTPKLAEDKRLAGLVQTVRGEAERLDRDIQNLLDATRVGSAGVWPRLEWSDPGDIVNSALAHCRSRLAEHPLQIDIAEDLPMIEVDSAMIAQALVQLIDNAVKYSPPSSLIQVTARAQGDSLRITVTDAGSGLTAPEIERMWDRFYRSERHIAVPGSGLGLWIAKAFVTANNGSLRASSSGVDCGTKITIVLPIKIPAKGSSNGDADNEL